MPRKTSLTPETGTVDPLIGTAYDHVKLVADNIDSIVALDPINIAGTEARIIILEADATAASVTAVAAADSITGMLVDATTLSPGSSATASWDGTTLTINVPRGDVGAQGNDGTSITLKGSVASFASLPLGAVLGDLWITVDTGDGYVSDGADNWSNTGPIQGPVGPQGEAGADGTSVTLKGAVANFTSLPLEAAAGDLWITLDTGDGYVSDGISSWSNVGPIQGPIGPQGVQGDTGPQGIQGLQGDAGTDGLTVLNGVVAPTIEGVDGDFYIDTALLLIHGPKAAGTWPAGTAITGPQGEQGIQGPQGIQGIQGIQGDTGLTGAQGDDGRTTLNGAVDPVIGDGVDGDFFINTVSNTIFGPKATTWPAGVSLVGPQGEQGIQGEQGPQGIQGEVGNIAAVVREPFTATAGQTLITLANPYVLASNALSVYVNGARYTDADFSETSTTSITMTVGLTVGDEVLVENGSLVSTTSVIVATIVAALPDTPDANTLYIVTG